MVTESLFMKVYSTVNEYCPLSNEVVEMEINWYQQWKRIRSHETKQWRLFIGKDLDSHFMKSNIDNNDTSRWKQWNNFIDNGNHIWNSRVKTVIDHDAKSHRLDPAYTLAPFAEDKSLTPTPEKKSISEKNGSQHTVSVPLWECVTIL